MSLGHSLSCGKIEIKGFAAHGVFDFDMAFVFSGRFETVSTVESYAAALSASAGDEKLMLGDGGRRSWIAGLGVFGWPLTP